MSARTYAEAIRVYQRHAQRMLSCVTTAVLSQTESIRAGDHGTRIDVGLMLNNGDPSLLDSDIPITLEMSQLLRIEQPDEERTRLWTTAIVAYSYVLRGHADQEICAYQWHPSGRSHVLHPHLHIGRGATGNVTTFGPRELHRIHFPTQLIELEDVLRLAISEFGVQPRRADWESILTSQHA